MRLVRPDLMAEISADRAVDRGGVWRLTHLVPASADDDIALLAARLTSR
ncbi:hypothetical protein [Streptomyces sp. NPDC091259]